MADKALQQAIERWIIENVDSGVVPSDEGSSDGLIYNLIHLLREGKGYRRYEYAADQNAELESWGITGAKTKR